MSAASDVISKLEQQYLRETPLPEFRPGDTVKVWVKISEGAKTRLQAFEGVCIRRKSAGNRSTFTVRKVSYNVGVERVFADNSPNVDHVEVSSRGRVRQARLYYLRDLSGKAARIKERAFDKTKAEKKPRRKRRKERKAEAKAAAAAAAVAPAEPAATDSAEA